MSIRIGILGYGNLGRGEWSVQLSTIGYGTEGSVYPERPIVPFSPDRGSKGIFS